MGFYIRAEAGYDGDDEENSNSYEDADVDVEGDGDESENVPVDTSTGGDTREVEPEEVNTENLELLARWAEHEKSLVEFKANMSTPSPALKYSAGWSALLFVASYQLEKIKKQEENVSFIQFACSC